MEQPICQNCLGPIQSGQLEYNRSHRYTTDCIRHLARRGEPITVAVAKPAPEPTPVKRKAKVPQAASAT